MSLNYTLYYYDEVDTEIEADTYADALSQAYDSIRKEQENNGYSVSIYNWDADNTIRLSAVGSSVGDQYIYVAHLMEGNSPVSIDVFSRDSEKEKTLSPEFSMVLISEDDEKNNIAVQHDDSWYVNGELPEESQHYYLMDDTYADYNGIEDYVNDYNDYQKEIENNYISENPSHNLIKEGLWIIEDQYSIFSVDRGIDEIAINPVYTDANTPVRYDIYKRNVKEKGAYKFDFSLYLVSYRDTKDEAKMKSLSFDAPERESVDESEVYNPEYVPGNRTFTKFSLVKGDVEI